MSTIVKTGVVLSVEGDPHLIRDIGVAISTVENSIYGDLHVAGNCAIIYYPPSQDRARMPRMGLMLVTDDIYFQRPGDPYCTLVIPARCIRIMEDKLHELDRAKWVQAGGGLM